jgi:hypothetical protein
VEDHHVDRPDVEARQRVQLTGTNRSFDLIVLITEERARKRAEARSQKSEARNEVRAKARSEPLVSGFSLLVSPKRQFCFNSVLCRPGGSCEAIRPDPIPNSAVKRLSANGTLSQDTGE